MSAKTTEVVAALRKQLCAPEWAFFQEVSNGTGARGGAAYADVVAMSLYPSRGLHLHGMEVKVSRGDWQRERSKPNKAEIIAEYCDFWWLVTGPGVVHDVGEIPHGWGWKLFDGGKIVTKKQPERLTPKDMDRVFLAALLRRASEVGDAFIRQVVEARTEAARTAFQESADREIERSTQRHKELIEKVRVFEEVSGISLSGWSDKKEIARLASAIERVGVLNGYNSAMTTAKRLEDAAKALRIALADCALMENLPDEAL